MIINKKAIILSIYVIYYLQLINCNLRVKFNTELKKKNNIGNNLFNIKNYSYSSILEKEQNFIFNQINLEKEIVPNTSLKGSIFFVLVVLNTKIPSIIIGKPEIGKSVSVKIISKENE